MSIKVGLIATGTPIFKDGKYFLEMPFFENEGYELKEDDTIAVLLVDTNKVIWRGKTSKKTEEQWSVYLKDPSNQRQITVWGSVG